MSDPLTSLSGLYMIVIFFNLILTIMVTLYPAPSFALRLINVSRIPAELCCL